MILARRDSTTETAHRTNVTQSISRIARSRCHFARPEGHQVCVTWGITVISDYSVCEPLVAFLQLYAPNLSAFANHFWGTETDLHLTEFRRTRPNCYLSRTSIPGHSTRDSKLLNHA